MFSSNRDIYYFIKFMNMIDFETENLFAMFFGKISNLKKSKELPKGFITRQRK